MTYCAVAVSPDLIEDTGTAVPVDTGKAVPLFPNLVEDVSPSYPGILGGL